MSSATSLIPKPDFDFCKDVPNIEAPSVSADGVVEEVKVKAEVPIVAADIPKKVEVVVPTVVEKEKAPSSSLVVTKPVATIASAEADMRREIDAFLLPYRERKIAAGQKQVHVTLQKDWEKVTKVTQSEGYTLEDYYNNQLGKPAQRALVREWFVHDIEIKNMVLIINSCLSVNKIQSSGFSGKAYAIEELKQIVNFNYARLDADSVDGDDTVLNRVTLRGFDKIIDDYVALLAKHAEVLRDIRNYKTV
jgi:hypothetical protein